MTEKFGKFLKLTFAHIIDKPYYREQNKHNMKQKTPVFQNIKS